MKKNILFIIFLLSVFTSVSQNTLDNEDNKKMQFPEGIEKLEYTGPIERHEEIIIEMINSRNYDMYNRYDFDRSPLVKSYRNRLEKMLQKWIVRNSVSKKVKGSWDYYVIKDSYHSLIKTWSDRLPGYIGYRQNDPDKIGVKNIVGYDNEHVPVLDGLLIATNSENQPEYAKEIRKRLNEDADYADRVEKLLNGRPISECALVYDEFFDARLAEEVIKGFLVKRIINAYANSKKSFEDKRLVIGESADYLHDLNNPDNQSTFRKLMEYVFKYKIN